MTTLDLHECGPYPELTRLTLDNSALTSVISAPLTYTPSLTTVEIFRCRMTSLPGFGPLESQLERLEMIRCNIELIPQGYFTNFGMLTLLNLQANEIKVFDPQWLSSSPNLQSLNLALNDLWVGSAQWMGALGQWVPNIRELKIRETQATEIPDEWLRDLIHLEILDVRSNPITFLPNKALFEKLENLDTVNLHGIDLHCDSTICWVKVIQFKYFFFHIYFNHIFFLYDIFVLLFSAMII